MDMETVPESWEERSEEDNDVIMLNEKNNQESDEGIEQYWERVKQGGNGKIVKIKEESTARNENQYSVLTNETEEMEVEVIGTKNMEEIAKEPVLKGDRKNIKTLNISSISKMTIQDIAETIYTYESIKTLHERKFMIVKNCSYGYNRFKLLMSIKWKLFRRDKRTGKSI